MKISRIIWVLFIIGAALAACSQQTPEAVSYTLDLTEYAISPNTIEARVGQQVSITFVNKGALEHEVMFGRDVMKMNNRPNGYQSDMFEMAHTEPQVVQDEMPGMQGSMGGPDHTDSCWFTQTGDEATITFIVTRNARRWEIGFFRKMAFIMPACSRVRGDAQKLYHFISFAEWNVRYHHGLPCLLNFCRRGFLKLATLGLGSWRSVQQ
jgi:plastocyanin